MDDALTKGALVIGILLTAQVRACVSDAKVDFATGCTYKFCVGAPGVLALFMSPSGGLAKPSSPSGGTGHRAPLVFEAYGR